jgi:hypothetical protein
MITLSTTDREFLQGLSICRPKEKKGDYPFENGDAPRILLPYRLLECADLILKKCGGRLTQPDIRTLVELIAYEKLNTEYRARSTPAEAPDKYSCSTLTQAVFANVGIHLPRYAIDQSYIGTLLEEPCEGSLVFYKNRFPITDSDRSIGHVGILTTNNTIIHGSSKLRKIVEQTFDKKPIMIRDVIPNYSCMLLILPEQQEGVETALDLLRFAQR